MRNNNPNVDSNHLNFVITNDGTMDITNAGTILSDNGTIYTGVGISNNATIGTLTNSGTLEATRNAVVNNLGATIDLVSLTSTSIVTGAGYTGLINNAGSITTLQNEGHITVDPAASYTSGAIYNSDGAITTLTNNGTITATTNQGYMGTGIRSTGSITTLTNNGTIAGDAFDIGYAYSGGGGAILLFDYGSGGINTLTNSSSGILDGGIINMGVLTTTLNNDGTINANGSPAAIYNGSDGNFTYENATIGTLTNTGTIAGGADYGILNAGASNTSPGLSTITSLINRGTITGSYGIFNGSTNATITTLTNAQGAGNNAGALTYSGVLPTNYNVILTSSTNYGQIDFDNASGTVAFGIDNSSVVTKKTYTSVVSGIANSASFSTDSGTFNSLNWNLVQQGSTDVWDLVFLNFSAGSVYDASVATGNNPAYNAARVIDNDAALSNLFSGLNGDQAISDAATQTLPLLTGSAIGANVATLHDVNKVVQSRVEGQYGLSAGNAPTSTHDTHFWFKPFGSWAQQNDDDGVAGYSADTYGSVLGVDGAISDEHRIGLAFAYANSRIDGNSNIAPQKATVNSYEGIVYGSHNLDAVTAFSYQADAALHNNDGKRSIPFTGDVAQSSYNSWSGHAGASLGRTFIWEGTSLTPSVRADYTLIHSQAYRETGAGLLNLNVRDQTYQELIPAVDVKLTHKLRHDITAMANLGGGYDLLNEQASITSAFAGAPSAAFSTKGIQPSPWIGRAGLGIVARLHNGAEVGMHYDAELRDGYDNQTASVKVRWAF